MPTLVRCPGCGTETRPPRQAIVRCGTAVCECVCSDCGQPFTSELAWWHWAGLEEAPPDDA